MRISPAGDGMGRFARFVVTVLVLAAILLVTGFFAVRTDGGRSLVADRLGKLLGTAVTVEKTSIGWPYDLVLDKVVSVDYSSDGPGLRAETVRIGCGRGWGLRVSAVRPELNLVHGSDGSWQPALFGRLGDLPVGDIAEISRITAGFRRRVTLYVRDGTIIWRDKDQKVLASAGGVSLGIAHVTLPGRRMHHYSLSVYNVLGAGGARIHDIERKWLADDATDYIELFRSGQKTSSVEGDFWEVDK